MLTLNNEINRTEVFNNTKFGNLNVLYFNQEFYFNLNEVGNILGVVNPRTTIDIADNDYVIKFSNSIVGSAYNRKLHNTGELFLTESGLYTFLLRSDKPEAKVFQKWVTKEVLPAIRKTGAYMTPETTAKLIKDPDFIEELLKNHIELHKENGRLNEVIESIKPKADYYDNVLDTSNTFNITHIAKELGISAISLNKKLKDLNIQFKSGECWVLKNEYIDKGYAEISTTILKSDDGDKTRHHLKWTEKGREFIHKLLKNNHD